MGARAVFVAALAAWLLGPAGAAFAAPGSYTVVPIAAPGVCVAQVNGINASGDVVGAADFADLPANTNHMFAFAWHAGVFTRLAAVPSEAGTGMCSEPPLSDAVGINAKGEIVGAGISATGSNLGPVEWASAKSQPVPISTACVAPGYADEVDAINASGTATGEMTAFRTCGGASSDDAFTVSPGGPLTDVLSYGTATGCRNGSVPIAVGKAINDRGQVLVLETSGGDCPGKPTQCVLTPGSGPGTLLPFGGAIGCEQRAFNDAGVVGGDWIGAQAVGSQAQYSLAGGPAVTLPPADGLPKGDVTALNNVGDVVGISFTGNGTTSEPTLWPAAVPPATGPAPAPVNLQTLIPASANVTLGRPFLIADNGDIVATTVGPTGTAYVELQPGGQQISGRLTDPAGNPQPGVAVNLTGTDNQGNPVSMQASTDATGSYTFALAPGTYSVSPVDPSDPAQGRYVASSCSGTSTPPVCAIVLNAGDQATASFKLVKLVINSTATDDDPQVSLDQGVCDTTPTASSQTCTLPAAIEVANKLGGGTIAFDIPGGGTPTITESATTPRLPEVTAPMTIDGTTQPGAQTVVLTATGIDPHYGLEIRSPGVTVRGMTIYGFAWADVYFEMGSGSDTLQANQLETINSTQRLVYGAVVDDNAVGDFGGGVVAGGNTPLAGHNVIQGNTIGGGRAFGGNSYAALNLLEPGDTIGGSQPGQGNLVAGGFAEARGTGDVVQGNTFLDTTGSVEVGDDATVGGASAAAGTGAGNMIDTTLSLQQNDVVQGNHIHGNGQTGILVANDDTIGGGRPELGNLIEGNGTTMPSDIADGGIAIGRPAGVSAHGPHSGNVIENNTIINNVGDGGVVVYEGTGNQIFDNEMRGNALGINLGGGPFRYNAINPLPQGPNDYQFYPNVLDSTEHGTGLHVSGLLDDFGHSRETFTIDLYAQRSCAQDSLTPGQGEQMLAEQKITTDRLGQASFLIDVLRSALSGARAFTATATAGDGSTSEFSPCLALGRRAPSFTGQGVTATNTALTVTTAPAATANVRRALVRENSRNQRHRTRLTLTLFCPPITTRYCAGRSALTVSLPHRKTSKAQTKFKLAPGQVATITLRVPKAELTALQHTHRLHGRLRITARDGARHPHRRHTVSKVKVVLAHRQA